MEDDHASDKKDVEKSDDTKRYESVGERRNFRRELTALQLRCTTYGGLIFLFISFIMFIAMCYFLHKMPSDVFLSVEQIGIAIIPPFIALVASIISALTGLFLLRMAGTAQKQVIPEQDYILISNMLEENNKDGIESYIKLSSLIGMTGFFTKIGFSGLPLATMGLTLIFSILSIFTRAELSSGFFDLGKLTLGAFIGSYVQKQTSGSKTFRS
jgi:hypothetical protein